MCFKVKNLQYEIPKKILKYLAKFCKSKNFAKVKNVANSIKLNIANFSEVSFPKISYQP
jgi:hypothetical protein